MIRTRRREQGQGKRWTECAGRKSQTAAETLRKEGERSRKTSMEGQRRESEEAQIFTQKENKRGDNSLK